MLNKKIRTKPKVPLSQRAMFWPSASASFQNYFSNDMKSPSLLRKNHCLLAMPRHFLTKTFDFLPFLTVIIAVIHSTTFFSHSPSRWSRPWVTLWHTLLHLRPGYHNTSSTSMNVQSCAWIQRGTLSVLVSTDSTSDSEKMQLSHRWFLISPPSSQISISSNTSPLQSSLMHSGRVISTNSQWMLEMQPQISDSSMLCYKIVFSGYREILSLVVVLF